MAFSEKHAPRVLVAAAVIGAALAIAAPLGAATITVNSAPDVLHNGAGQCALTGSGTCSLRDAITYANSTSGSDTISFNIGAGNPVITLASTLPDISYPVSINGATGGATKVVIKGGGVAGGLAVTTNASPTSIANLVLNGFTGAAISITDGGNSVTGCYIGTDETGAAAASPANAGDGIYLTTTAGSAYTLPLPGGLVGNNVSANTISGNGGNGITITGQRTLMNTVTANMIGTDPAGLSGVPNYGHGVAITGDAFLNTIGPANIISANGTTPSSNPNADGINVSGSILVANIISSNLIGVATAVVAPSLGQTRDGIRVTTTRASGNVLDSTTIGPANIIGFNGEDGIQVTGSSEYVRVYGNFIGAGEAGAVLPFFNIGNTRDGVRITSSNHTVGGSTVPEANLITGNGGSGIYLNGSGITVNTLLGNIIGIDPTRSISFRNYNDGITITSANGAVIGGTGTNDGNVISGNGRHGIKITGSGGSGSGNAVRRNLIYGNGTRVQGIAIDLDVAADGVDPTDNTPTQDPNTNYGNQGQNSIVITGAPLYDPISGSTTIPYTLQTSATTQVRIDFFAADAAGTLGNGDGKVWLGESTVTTDALGQFAASAVITPSPAYVTNTKYIAATVTSLTGPAPNNTSEFSAAAGATPVTILQISAE